MVLADLNAEEKLSNLVKGEINSISLVGIMINGILIWTFLK